MFLRVISWEEYIDPSFPLAEPPLAVTIGVFDGVHRGHQTLIRHICDSPYTPAVVTFRQNPLEVLKPGEYTGDILTLDQKLKVLEDLGVQLTVLIDFSKEFGKISGRDFIGLLLNSRPVKLVALGQNFRCGCGLDTGVKEIERIAGGQGVKVWAAPPVMDGGLPISSSRIRQALAAGQTAEAEKLLNRSLKEIE